MCGRYRLTSKERALIERFGLDEDAEWAPRYNIAPSQEVPAVVQRPDEPSRRLARMRWGLIPSWAKDAKIGYKMINARSESVASKPAYRAAFKSRRCLIPADGFYEWKAEGKAKLPYCFCLTGGTEEGGELFAFAGLWETWKSPEGGTIVESCTILTTAPNALVAGVHDRMPVILPPERYEIWLDPGFKDTAELESLLVAYPANAMTSFAVTSRINSAKSGQ